MTIFSGISTSYGTGRSFLPGSTGFFIIQRLIMVKKHLDRQRWFLVEKSGNLS